MLIMFNFIRPSKLYSMAELIDSLTEDEKKTFNDMNLMLMRSKENNSIYVCDIHQMMFKDIETLDDPNIDKIYDDLNIKYGNRFIDKFILKDPSIMKSKLNVLFNMLGEMHIEEDEQLEFQMITNDETESMQQCIADTILEYPKFINCSYKKTRFSNIILCNYVK